MPDADRDTRDALVELALDAALGRYAAVVDGQEWNAWIELFTDDCSYAVYSLENFERGLPLAYMLDDNHGRLRDRVMFITEVWSGTVEPYRTRHVIQRTHTERVEEHEYQVQANLIVTYTELDGIPGVLASGYYTDRIRLTDDGARFVEKNVYLDGMPARYLVYPL
jgi:3-phenylpropionate/cinnamic acid dioxygenase small subunit